MQNLLFGVVYISINFRFTSIVSKPTKTSNKDLSHNNTVSATKFLLQRHKKFLFDGWRLNDFLVLPPPRWLAVFTS